MTSAAIMGAGSWGTAFAAVMADAGTDVTLWARRAEAADAINTERRNVAYLPELQLDERISATADAAQALEGADLVVLAVPSQSLRGNLEQWRDVLPQGAPLVSLMKGIELGTHLRMSQVIAEVAGVPLAQVAVVSGPNLAKEIAQKQPAAAVVAAPHHGLRAKVAEACAAPYFRPYTNTDVIGAEIGGACKNVIALACGMASGKGLGNNTMATIITRGLAEITRLGVELGADPFTFSGLAGMGDLVATCTSTLSRNRTFGYRLGQGGTIEEAKAATNGQVAEGVYSCDSIYRLAQQAGVEMPITHAVYGVCYEGVAVEDMIIALMGRSKKSE
mgnify:CR=1 FL=1